MISLVGFGLCYLPMMIPLYNSRAADMIGVFSSDIHTYSLIWSIAVASHLMFEVALDYKLPLENNLPRVCIIFALGIPNILKLMHFYLSVERGTSLIICSYYGQDVLVVGGLISSLLPADHTPFSCSFPMALNSIIIGSELLFTLEPFIGRQKVLLFVFCALTVVALLVLIFIAFKRIISAYRKQSVHAQYTAVFISCLVWNGIAKWMIFFLFGSRSWSNTTGLEMACRVYVDIITAMIAFSLPGRLAKHEAYMAQVKCSG